MLGTSRNAHFDPLRYNNWWSALLSHLGVTGPSYNIPLMQHMVVLEKVPSGVTLASVGCGLVYKYFPSSKRFSCKCFYILISYWTVLLFSHSKWEKEEIKLNVTLSLQPNRQQTSHSQPFLFWKKKSRNKTILRTVLFNESVARVEG